MSRSADTGPGAAPVALPRHRQQRASSVTVPALLLVGFAGAVVLRSAVGGSEVARSAPAGLVFAAALVLLARVTHVPLAKAPSRPRPAWSSRVGVGLAGAALLCLPALVHVGFGPGSLAVRPFGLFPAWAVVVTVVAAAEEAFLRGTLFRALEPFGTPAAVLVPALAFAALHVPLYGWGAVPLDLAVGVWLGALRSVTGSALAPGIAHVAADFAAWWLG